MSSAGSALPGSLGSGLESCETVNPTCYTFLNAASRAVPQGQVSCSTRTTYGPTTPLILGMCHTRSPTKSRVPLYFFRTTQ